VAGGPGSLRLKKHNPGKGGHAEKGNGRDPLPEFGAGARSPNTAGFACGYLNCHIGPGKGNLPNERLAAAKTKGGAPSFVPTKTGGVIIHWDILALCFLVVGHISRVTFQGPPSWGQGPYGAHGTSKEAGRPCSLPRRWRRRFCRAKQLT